MPPNAVKVDRATRFGNPFRIGEQGDAAECVALFRHWLECGPGERSDLAARRLRILADLHLLRGKHLACWCKPDAACHADVLLDLANRPDVA